MASSNSNSPIPKYYEDEVFGGFSTYSSSDKEEMDLELEDLGFPPYPFEESEDEMEDPILNHIYLDQQQRHHDAFNFIISVDVEEVSNMDDPRCSEATLPEEVFTPCQPPLMEFGQGEEQ